MIQIRFNYNHINEVQNIRYDNIICPESWTHFLNSLEEFSKIIFSTQRNDIKDIFKKFYQLNKFTDFYIIENCAIQYPIILDDEIIRNILKNDFILNDKEEINIIFGIITDSKEFIKIKRFSYTEKYFHKFIEFFWRDLNLFQFEENFMKFFVKDVETNIFKNYWNGLEKIIKEEV